MSRDFFHFVWFIVRVPLSTIFVYAVYGLCIHPFTVYHLPIHHREIVFSTMTLGLAEILCGCKLIIEIAKRDRHVSNILYVSGYFPKWKKRKMSTQIDLK